ncbi:uncharacterized protein L969DRAFT_95321 [Mixia osmundae IAM 14324]|uniref:Uncharacterized protein n=1 Tax=Mixia osmundae (strain CBS 9802 / IAM 14324 / JCM 22182 / KY 12970) TaxID=764103 RepID=G7DZ12_MIXOS|nr:uncharacterized protein L969DRAFT_95321 [Mixia osmundae IAM 14324]KEI38224.1 hypothetical protein L969DRAFT_95321 [Mixia osmundae IAM 14324]GAA95822.1 hypothetical protein E5Q_02479 [Mixia osmundae IAM 14324]
MASGLAVSRLQAIRDLPSPVLGLDVLHAAPTHVPSTLHLQLVQGQQAQPRQGTEPSSTELDLAQIDDAIAMLSSNIIPPSQLRDRTKQQLAEAALAAREEGKRLKRHGDALGREKSVPDHAMLALLHQYDGLLCYILSFWLDDEAAGRSTTGGKNKTVCMIDNWTSLLGRGLLRFVTDSCHRLHQPNLASLCMLLEGLILQKISTFERRVLHHQVSSSMGKSSGSSVTSDHGPTPPGESPAGSTSAGSIAAGVTERSSQDMLNSFVRISSNLETISRYLNQSYSSLAKAIANDTNLAPVRELTRTSLIEHDDVPSSLGEMYSFAWPLNVHCPASIPHACFFAKAVLHAQAKSSKSAFMPSQAVL